MKTMARALFVLLSVFLALPVEAGEDLTEKKAALTRLWETGEGLQVPESVLYHAESKTLFVSNINGQPTEKNGQGFISKLSLAGKILDLKWATGLDAPKGSVIYKDSLFVSDIDRLVEIDLKTGLITTIYPAPGAVFLNDVAADEYGNIYVSDMDEAQSAIWILSGKSFSIWLTSPEIRSPNGLHMDGNTLMVGNSGDGLIKRVRLSDKSLSVFATVGSGIDGLRPDGQGKYIVSDWTGKTSRVSPTGIPEVLIDTSADKINSADLEYVIDKKMLLIPTFFNNTVVAWEIK